MALCAPVSSKPVSGQCDERMFRRQLCPVQKGYGMGCYRYLSLPWGQPEPRGWWLMPREELPPFLLDGIQPLGLNSFSDTLLRALTCRYNSGLMFHKLWPRLR